MLSGPVQIFNINPLNTGTTQLHTLGTPGVTTDGRKYRYAEAGGTALVAGNLQMATDITTLHEDLAVNTFLAGDTTIDVTLGNTAIVANDYDGGYVFIIDETGQGIGYLIDSAPATSGNGTVTIQLKQAIVVGAVADTTVTLYRNKYKEIIVTDGDQANFPVGVPNVAFAANEFGWIQTGGLCSILVDTNDTVAGQPITIGDSENGAVEIHNAATEVIVGNQPTGAGADASEFGIYNLTLD